MGLFFLGYFGIGVLMLHIRTTYSGAVAAMARGLSATKALMRIWMEDGYEATLDYWHKEIRPKHFEESAADVYGYGPRKEKYRESKLAAKGHRKPLVYSGESERATERNYIKATGRSASLHMDAGNLAWPVKGGRINMRHDLTKVLPEEEQAMADVFERSVDASINSRHDWFEKTFR
jgi:hypothetical protein